MAGGGIVPGWPLLVVEGAQASFYEPPVTGGNRRATNVQGLADARKRARRSGLVQFFAVYQFDRGGILQMCHTVGELCNHAVRGSMVWRQTSDTIEFCILITCCILITA